MEIICRVISWEEEEKGKKGGNDAGVKKYNWYKQNKQGDVKNSKGKGEAKELIGTNHGRELSGGLLEGRGVPGRWGQRKKN